MSNSLEKLFLNPAYQELLDEICDPCSGKLCGIRVGLGIKNRIKFRQLVHLAIQKLLMSDQTVFGFVEKKDGE